MKFTTIFVLFNAVFVFSFLFIFIMPFAVLGAEHSLGFWARNWPLAAFFAIALGALNAFFLSNRAIFTLVEREDWAALQALLGKRMYEKGSFRTQYVRLMVNASLLRADLQAVERLETELRARKPAMLRRNAVAFAVPRLLRNDPDAVLSFTEEFLDAKDVDAADWLRFDHAFALVLKKRGAEAGPFLSVSLASREPALALLSAYLLANVAAPAAVDAETGAALMQAAEARRGDLKARYRKSERWAKESERARADVHVVILTKLLDDAGAWLFSEEGAAIEA